MKIEGTCHPDLCIPLIVYLIFFNIVLQIKIHVRKHRQPCRVPSCKLYGKPIYNLGYHMVTQHKLNMAAHEQLEKCSIQVPNNDAPKSRKYRKAGQCDHPRCKKRGGIFQRFDRHLKSMHKCTVTQYHRLMNM